MIFQMLSDEKIGELAEDIKKNGLLCPVEIFEGKIIDGRNRWMACLRAGIKPETVEVEPEDPVSYVLSLNLHRRHLDETQRAMVGSRARAEYEAAAKERQKLDNESKENLPYSQKGQARDQAGKAVGVSGRSVEHASNVLKNGSESLIAACDQGKVAVSAAAKLSQLPKDKQDEVIEYAKSSKQPIKKVVAKAAKHVVPTPDADWTASEKKRRAIVEKGGTVVANKHKDKCLIRWASEEGVLLPIDRGTPWGNPFIMGDDGSRDEVCDAYDWYLNYKPSLTGNRDRLRGKVLACWCYPERCHGDALLELLK